MRPRQNGRHFAYDMFKCIFLNENVWIPIEISLTFVPKGWINNNPALFQKMAWRRPGDKPLSEPMMVSSLTHICVTRSQWVKTKQRGFVFKKTIYLYLPKRSNALTLHQVHCPSMCNGMWFSVHAKNAGLPLLYNHSNNNFLTADLAIPEPQGPVTTVYNCSLWMAYKYKMSHIARVAWWCGTMCNANSLQPWVPQSQCIRCQNNVSVWFIMPP